MSTTTRTRRRHVITHRLTVHRKTQHALLTWLFAGGSLDAVVEASTPVQRWNLTPAGRRALAVARLFAPDGRQPQEHAR